VYKILGISDEELNFVQKYKFQCLIDLMKNDSNNFYSSLLITDLNRLKNVSQLESINKKLPTSNFSVLYCNFNWFTEKNLDVSSFKSIDFLHIRFNLKTFKHFRNITK
jgi:hypothetical protein